MPTETENVQYLYLILTHGGSPNIDWDAVGTALDLKKGAVSKRWSRLKKSMENGEKPAGSVYKFLWLCVKHGSRDKVPDWNEIAKQCGTTPGAASKRYSRMKQAFEAGDAAPENNPASPAPKTPSKTLRKKAQVNASDNEGTPTPKRKRASPKQKTIQEDEDVIKAEEHEEDDDEEHMQTPKKPKVVRSKPASKSKIQNEAKAEHELDETMSIAEATTFIKEINVGDDCDMANSDNFVDAQRWVKDLVGGTDDESEV
ncbi:hypothetical protein BDU57DRAFT_441970 [Ampelomyces quisqualis]|uniref:Myb-like DNA-binding domain-containing protein n=1 Tax=Ampelomyces quisqualis TaxID=50730 RepID=A0A6A5QY02_AMPQU|nr:hypothetical protein BDU57DRAFT_441970 [Ampelomyces quisqualis]